MAKKALGRGLGALIGSGTARPAPTGGPAETAVAVAAGSPDVAQGQLEVASADRVRHVPLDRIVASPLQPRREFEGEALRELMDSIREHGIIQPLIVREVRGSLELIAGERRFRASRELGLAEVPVIVREATDRDVLEMALIENLQREDLNPVEEARAYVRLAAEFKLRQEDIAKRVGKSRAGVANSMRLLDLPDDVLEMLGNGQLSPGHAKVLLGLKEALQISEIARQIVMRQLSVRATEKMVELAMRKADKPELKKVEGTSAVQAALNDVERRLRSRFTSNIAIKHGEKKGRIEIDYYGTDDLNRILDLLGVEEANFS